MIGKAQKILSLLFGCALFLFLHSEAHAISWKYDLQSALNDAKKLQKPVMADFYTDWCGWCKKLDSDTYSDKKVSELADKFICVKVDGDKYRDLAAKYGVSGYPTVIFFNSSGNVEGSIRGYEGPADFARDMNAILAKTGGSASTGKKASISKTAAKNIKPAPRSQLNNRDLIYNGYMEIAGEDLIAQVNYKGNTNFIKKGDKFLGYIVSYIDKGKVTLDSQTDQIVMEYKKPVRMEISSGQPSATLGGFISGDADSEIMAGETGIFKGIGAPKISLLFLAGPVIWFFIVLCIYFIICLQFIAEKTNTAHSWMAWLPIVNVFLICRIGRISYLWALALLLPVINIFVSGFMWHKIAKARGKSGWIGILIGVSIIPPTNILALGYLALSK
ncbi:MAG: thioredoxin domain-containing protein [Candidatus Omnitrophota bacterium]